MVRPNTLHKGHFVPNAGVVAEPTMAEPDQIDFNISGNNRWGVVSGCEVTISGGVAATVTAGIAVVNGVPVIMTGGQEIVLDGGTSQPRFDLICTDGGGTLTRVPGVPSANPVFPDPPLSRTVLAAVYVPIGSTALSDYVIDKRNMLQPVLVGTGNGDTTLVLNRFGGVDVFRINSEGKLFWNNGEITIERSDEDTITLTGNLVVTGALSAQGITTTYLTSTGPVTGSNIIVSDTFPPTADDGTILIKGGLLYVRRGGVWEQVVTAGSGGDQPGDIKHSMRAPSEMPGWVPLMGQTVDENNDSYTQLFTVSALAGLASGVAPNRSMTLPDARDRVLVGNNPLAVGSTGGANTVVLTTANLPPHKHNVVLGQAGLHNHVLTMQEAGYHGHTTHAGGTMFDGRHTHPVDDDGHTHPGAKGWGGLSNWPIIALAWGGTNLLDGPIGDSSHTYAVEPMNETAVGYSGIGIGSEGSGHVHWTTNEGAHVHEYTMSAEGEHAHPVTEDMVGASSPVAIRPKYLVTYTYIKL